MKSNNEQSIIWGVSTIHKDAPSQDTLFYLFSFFTVIRPYERSCWEKNPEQLRQDKLNVDIENIRGCFKNFFQYLFILGQRVKLLRRSASTVLHLSHSDQMSGKILWSFWIVESVDSTKVYETTSGVKRASINLFQAVFPGLIGDHHFIF